MWNIQAKEIYYGALAASRSGGSLGPAGLVQMAPASSLCWSGGGYVHVRSPLLLPRSQRVLLFIPIFGTSEGLDIVGLQEMIEETFLRHELEGLSRNNLAWHLLHANCHTGGFLLGVKEDTFEVEDMDHGKFYVSMSLTNSQSNLR